MSINKKTKNVTLQKQKEAKCNEYKRATKVGIDSNGNACPKYPRFY